MYKVESTDWYPQDRRTLWLAYTDHARWSEWTSIPKSTLIKEGNEEKNGLGAVRKLGPGGPFDAHEEILVFQANELMEYTVNKGPLPFINHRGVVKFSDENNGTRITWHCTYETRLSFIGKIMEKITQYVFDSSLKGLHNFPFETIEPSPKATP